MTWESRIISDEALAAYSDQPLTDFPTRVTALIEQQLATWPMLQFKHGYGEVFAWNIHAIVRALAMAFFGHVDAVFGNFNHQISRANNRLAR